MQPFTLREPTHEPLDFGVLMQLATELMGLAGGQPLSAAQIDGFAQEHGYDRAMVWAAAGMHPMMQLERKHEAALAVCTGRCQLWGAAELLGAVLDEVEGREKAGKSGLDVLPRNCLNACHDAPMVMLAVPEGVVPLPRADIESVRVLLGEWDEM